MIFQTNHFINSWSEYSGTILVQGLICCSCRYVFGGEDGRLKFGPPDEHSPMIESLPPKEKLRIEPCFYFGELHKNIISGPTEFCDYQPFVPNPVSTSHVSCIFCINS